MAPRAGNPEWAHYYRVGDMDGASALHAHFVSHRYPRHSHAYCVIGLVESGVQTYIYRGTRYYTPAGDVFVVNPDEPHTGEAASESGYVYRTLNLTADWLRSALCEFAEVARHPFLKGAVLHDAAVATRLARLHRGLTLQAPKLEQDLLLLEAVGLLFIRHSDAPCATVRTGREHKAIGRAREYLEAHFDEDVSLAKLARVVSLSPFYFARLFEKGAGVPPHRYLEGVRIRNACALLDRGEKIASVAASVGYADQSHLTKRFKRYLGITPRQYRRNA